MTRMPDGDELLGVKDLQRITKLGSRAVKSAITDNGFPEPIKVSNRHLWLKSEVLAWMQRISKRTKQND